MTAPERQGGADASVTKTGSAPVPKAAFWAGWIMSGGPAIMLLLSAAMKFAKPPAVAEGFARLGWSESLALALGIVELGATILYLIPQTAVLGAILLTGFLGGATATHVRIGDPWFTPVVLGVSVWLGLYLREPRLRSLVPLRRSP